MIRTTALTSVQNIPTAQPNLIHFAHIKSDVVQSVKHSTSQQRPQNKVSAGAGSSDETAHLQKQRLTDDLAAAYSILYAFSADSDMEDDIASIGVSISGVLCWQSTILMTKGYLEGTVSSRRLRRSFSDLAETALRYVRSGMSGSRGYDWKDHVKDLLEASYHSMRTLDIELAKKLIEVLIDVQMG